MCSVASVPPHPVLLCVVWFVAEGALRDPFPDRRQEETAQGPAGPVSVKKPQAHWGRTT